MLFESRGEYGLRAKLTRIEHIESIIETYISSFLSRYLYGFRTANKAELNKCAIDELGEFDIQEDDIDSSLRIVRDVAVEVLMYYQEYQLKSSLKCSNVTMLDRLYNLKKELRDTELLYTYLSCLKFNGSALDWYFSQEVVNEIEEVIIEHIEDIKDVLSGEVIKTIREKEQELKEETEAYIKMQLDAEQAYRELCELGAFDDDEPYYHNYDY